MKNYLITAVVVLVAVGLGFIMGKSGHQPDYHNNGSVYFCKR